MRKQQKGFSLIELLIVVAIILIIAAIAIPNLMRARMAANDSSAAGSEHTIVVGEVGYYGAYPQVGYGTLAQLGGWPFLAFPAQPMLASSITTWPPTAPAAVRAVTTLLSLLVEPRPLAGTSTPRRRRSRTLPVARLTAQSMTA